VPEAEVKRKARWLSGAGVLRLLATVDNCNRAEFDMYFATSFNGQTGTVSAAITWGAPKNGRANAKPKTGILVFRGPSCGGPP
jgi:hypothetical protein